METVIVTAVPHWRGPGLLSAGLAKASDVSDTWQIKNDSDANSSLLVTITLTGKHLEQVNQGMCPFNMIN